MCVWARGEWANLLLHVQVTLLLRLHQLRLALVFIELSSAPGLGSPLPHLRQDWTHLSSARRSDAASRDSSISACGTRACRPLQSRAMA